MFEFKDYSDEDSLPENVIPVARNSNGAISTITQEQAQQTFQKKGLTYGPNSPRAIQQSHKLMVGLGIGAQPGPDTVPIGVNDNGQQLYSNKQFAESKDRTVGKVLNETTYSNFAPAKVFNETEAAKFLEIGNHAADPDLLDRLNKAKTNGDTYAFRDAINRTVGVAGGKDDHGSDFTTLQLFDNWHNFSDGQKSLALAGVGNQNFKFEDGSTLANRKVTPDIGDVRGMTPKDIAELGAAGTNPYPVVKHWDDMVTLQQSQFNPRSAISVSANAQKLNLLGYGEDGTAVNIKKESLDSIGATAEPHMGVGALSIPADQNPPPDYVKIGTANGRTQIIPKAHVNTAITGTETSVANAQSMYQKWPALEKPKSVGVVGGNQMLAGTMALTDTNPHAVSFAVSAKTALHTRAAKEEQKSSGGASALPAVVGAIKTGASIYNIVNKIIEGNSVSSAGAGAINSAEAADIGTATMEASTGGGGAVGSSIGGGQILADGTATTAAPVATGVEGGTVLADGTTVGQTFTGIEGAFVGNVVPALAAAYGTYELTNMALAANSARKDQTGDLIKQGAKAAGFLGAQFGLGIGLGGSGKGERQQIRDQYRKAIIESGSKLFDEDYQGTLYDGTTFDFGKDNFSFKEGKGNTDGNIDLSTKEGGRAASFGNVIAAVQGVTDGKAREAIATQFAAAMLAQGADKVDDNAAHFLQQLGVKDGSEVQAVLNKLRAEDSISDDEYRAFSNASREILPSNGKARELTPQEIDEVNGKGEAAAAQQPAQSQSVPPVDDKVAAFDGMVQHSANILVNGDPAKPVGLEYEANKITDANYKKQFKDIRAAYAQKGISSKQIGLHLINQAYAEGRISEIEYTSSYMTLHAVFDDNKSLYDSITTGASNGRTLHRERKFGKAAE